MKILKFLFILPLLATLICPALANSACEKPNFPEFNDDYYYITIASQTGEELRSALHSIIKNHYRYSYDCVWDILLDSDENPLNPNNVILLYTRRSDPKTNRDRGQNDPDSWNREHVWAKSHGFPESKQHAYTDAHHIRPADRSINSDRSNREFDDGGVPTLECSDCLKTKDSWFPGEQIKGDVARMLFYMDVRYEGEAGQDGGTPDLQLVNYITRSNVPEFGVLCILYRWHLEDKVDNAEIARNEKIYSWQGNRNPFIDHPEWVEIIWKSYCDK